MKWCINGGLRNTKFQLKSKMPGGPETSIQECHHTCKMGMQDHNQLMFMPRAEVALQE